MVFLPLAFLSMCFNLVQKDFHLDVFNILGLLGVFESKIPLGNKPHPTIVPPPNVASHPS